MPTITPGRINSYAWHPYRASARYFCTAITALVAAICFCFEFRFWPVTVLGALFAWFAVNFAIGWQTLVDPEAETLTREGRLFDRFLIWRGKRSLADFSAVVCQRVKNPEGCDSVYVGLRPKRGWFFNVRYFTAGTDGRCDEADECVRQLAADMRLEIIHETFG